MSSEISPNRISYPNEAYAQSQTRQVARQAQIKGAGLLTQEQLSPEEIQSLQIYMNNTLGHVQQLKYPFSFPSIGAA